MSTAVIPLPKRRRSLRLPSFDYAQPGAYFVTICARGRRCLFGRLTDGQLIESRLGSIAARCWAEIPSHFANVQLDAFVLMPNHVHGILLLTEPSVGVDHDRPLPRVPQVVRAFKGAVSREAGFQVWQRNYYEHVVRTEKELNLIRRYVGENPLRWPQDPEKPPSYEPHTSES